MAGVVVPVNFRLSAPEVLFVIEDSGAKVLCVDDTLLPLVQQLQSDLKQVEAFIYIGEGQCPEGMHAYEELIAQHPEVDDAGRGYDDLFGLYYTGGTTGRAKGVMLTHSNICANALPVIANMNYTAETRYLHAAPMFHAADCGSTFALTMVAGCHVFLDRFSPENLLQTLQDERITATMLVPAMLNMMLHSPSFGNYDLSRLSDLIYGASPMPEALIRALLKARPDKRFTQCLGMTEMSPVITCLHHYQHELEGPHSKRLRSVGQAAVNVEVMICDENDKEVSRGTVGQILCKGTPLMAGYWQQPELTRRTMVGGWLHTGDAGYMDEDGYIYVVDRVKDMIISGGENIYSVEVESTLSLHPSIKECAVIGIPHDLWGESVHAVVVLKDQAHATEEELDAHCRAHIAGYKIPRSWEFRAESLPLSAAGKVLKRQLRDEHSKRSAKKKSKA
jgi:long-chain acyl-CoA synthetase